MRCRVAMIAHGLALLCVVLTPLLGRAQVRLDADGEPLPPGALLRLGSARWRHEDDIGALACTRDGKWVVSGGQAWLRFRDAATGKTVGSFQVGNQYRSTWMALSPDSRLVAHTAQLSAVVIVREIPGGKVRHILKQPGVDWRSLAFSPDSATLATSTEEKILLWNIATGKLQAAAPWPGGKVRAETIAFGTDNQTLFARSDDNTLRRLDLTTRKVRTLTCFGKDECHDFALSPDGKTLAAYAHPPKGGNQAYWLIIDPAADQVRHRLPIFHYSHVRPAFSADSKTVALLVGGNIQVCDVATGAARKIVEQPFFGGVALDADGRTLYLGHYHRLRRWRLPTLEQMDPMDLDFGTAHVQYAPTGKVLFSSDRQENARLWDTATGQLLQRLPANPSHCRNTPFSPDGRFVAGIFANTPYSKAKRPEGLLSWEVATGKLARRLPAERPEYFALSADHRLLAWSQKDALTIHLWDLEKDHSAGTVTSARRDIHPLAFSPDGRLLAYSKYTHGICLWDSRTGAHHQLERPSRYGRETVGFSPDGLLMVMNGCQRLLLWDVCTGERLAAYDSNYHQGATGDGLEACGILEDATARFTRDGRGLVMSDGKCVKLYDVAQGRFVGSFPTGKNHLECFDLSPDNKTFTTGQTDGTLLIWDAAPLLKALPRAPLVLPAKELATLWQTLGGSDARKALAARWRLAQARGVAAFLKTRLAPARSATAREIDEPIAALGHAKFAVRERATRLLREWGELAVPALGKALAGNHPLEMRRRLEQLYVRGTALLPPPEEVQALRGVAVLEAAGGTEARALLQALANGAPGARVTAAARAALQRLTKAA